MNLALGYTEEFYSLATLAQMHERTLEEVYDVALVYIVSRECFRKEWAKMTCKSECPLPDSCLIERCFDE